MADNAFKIADTQPTALEQFIKPHYSFLFISFCIFLDIVFAAQGRSLFTFNIGSLGQDLPIGQLLLLFALFSLLRATILPFLRRWLVRFIYSCLYSIIYPVLLRLEDSLEERWKITFRDKAYVYKDNDMLPVRVVKENSIKNRNIIFY